MPDRLAQGTCSQRGDIHDDPKPDATKPSAEMLARVESIAEKCLRLGHASILRGPCQSCVALALDTIAAERPWQSRYKSDIDSLSASLAAERAALADSRAMCERKDATLLLIVRDAEGCPVSSEACGCPSIDDCKVGAALALTPDSVRAQREGGKK